MMQLRWKILIDWSLLGKLQIFKRDQLKFIFSLSKDRRYLTQYHGIRFTLGWIRVPTLSVPTIIWLKVKVFRRKNLDGLWDHCLELNKKLIVLFLQQRKRVLLSQFLLWVNFVLLNFRRKVHKMYGDLLILRISLFT